jgi:hypothetical protein
MPRYNRDSEEDWARRIPEDRYQGPYRDYGWEPDQSGLPEFRDPNVHLTAQERREIRQRGRFGRRFRRGAQRSDYPGEGYFGEPYGREYAPQGYYSEPFGRGFNDEGYFNVTADWRTPGPYTGYGPRGYRRSDRRIWEDSCERLTQHGLVDASDIQVEVEQGEVTLRGTVEDRAEKRLAEDAIDTIPGVWDIHNRLTLRSRPSGVEGREVEVGHSGVYPVSGPPAPDDAQTRTLEEWGNGEQPHQETEEQQENSAETSS